MLNIRQLRTGWGWTQEYVAERIGLTPESVQRIETNKRKPSYEVLVKLEALFGKPHTELFSEAPPPAA